MGKPEESVEDIFLPGGKLRGEMLTDSANAALQESVRLTVETQWDTVRSPHVFMGVLAVADARIQEWARRLQTNPEELLEQFQRLFFKEDGEADSYLALNREFFSDNVIRHLRDALNRSHGYGRKQITQMDLLISLLTVPNSIVAECLEQMGPTAAKLTEIALIAENIRLDGDRSGTTGS